MTVHIRSTSTLRKAREMKRALIRSPAHGFQLSVLGKVFGCFAHSKKLPCLLDVRSDLISQIF